MTEQHLIDLNAAQGIGPERCPRYPDDEPGPDEFVGPGVPVPHDVCVALVKLAARDGRLFDTELQDLAREAQGYLDSLPF